VSGQLQAPAALPPGEKAPSTHWVEGWVDPRAGLDYVDKRILDPTGTRNSDLSVVQPVSSRYTDCDIQKNWSLLYFDRLHVFSIPEYDKVIFEMSSVCVCVCVCVCAPRSKWANFIHLPHSGVAPSQGGAH
jgi:hypothetical protein